GDARDVHDRRGTQRPLCEVAVEQTAPQAARRETEHGLALETLAGRDPIGASRTLRSDPEKRLLEEPPRGEPGPLGRKRDERHLDVTAFEPRERFLRMG